MKKGWPWLRKIYSLTMKNYSPISGKFSSLRWKLTQDPVQHLLKPDKGCITFGNETKANSSYFADVKIQFNQGYSRVIRVYTGIKSLKHDLILGKPWHFDEEPRINWKTHKVIVDGTNIQTQDNVDSQEIKPEVHFISH